jgi:hypothetical protein
LKKPVSIGFFKKNLITGHAGAVHEDDRDALFVEHPWPFIGVGHHDFGRARHIAVDDARRARCRAAETCGRSVRTDV